VVHVTILLIAGAAWIGILVYVLALLTIARWSDEAMEGDEPLSGGFDELSSDGEPQVGHLWRAASRVGPRPM
jgi:hypothetical protein